MGNDEENSLNILHHKASKNGLGAPHMEQGIDFSEPSDLGFCFLLTFLGLPPTCLPMNFFFIFFFLFF